MAHEAAGCNRRNRPFALPLRLCGDKPRERHAPSRRPRRAPRRCAANRACRRLWQRRMEPVRRAKRTAMRPHARHSPTRAP